MTDADGYSYPPEPQAFRDKRDRFHYVDYDGESLVIWFEEDGDLWVDKRGEGPIYIRKADIALIVAELTRGER